ncbi:hypothetical protein [Paenibacillus gansuensis]|uniref:Sporulation protein n=1 Tax=Paenibacillus gansuensis TaxID=306542 RepID=A0ABW5PGL0_9BACL
MLRRRVTVVLLGAALTMAPGCASGGGGTNGADRNVKGYADDGYLGMSSANPNLRISPTGRTNASDINLMRQAIFSIPEVKNAEITMNGPHANVNLVLVKGLAREEVRRVENQAKDLLQLNVPRYAFRVTSGARRFGLFSSPMR